MYTYNAGGVWVCRGRTALSRGEEKQQWGIPGSRDSRASLYAGGIPPVRNDNRLGSNPEMSTLHCTALHCSALHCTALHCTALHCTALHCPIQSYPILSYPILSDPIRSNIIRLYYNIL